VAASAYPVGYVSKAIKHMEAQNAFASEAINELTEVDEIWIRRKGMISFHHANLFLFLLHFVSFTLSLAA
jgi:hypothetical protein